MTSQPSGAPPRSSRGIQVDHDGLRRRIERFARLRAARRALPPTAMDLEQGPRSEARADLVRKRLSALARPESDEPLQADALAAACASLDGELDAIEDELLARVDEIEFASLRASIPRAVGTHRHEVIALLETILEDRDGLVERLAKVEYLVTILATVEGEGRRVIVHDPASLTPALRDFAESGSDPADAAAFAIELYQAAALDAERENPMHLLRESRARKLAMGLGVLAPQVLRAVVTYNARMYNRVECFHDCSREADALLGQLLPVQDGGATGESPSAKARPGDDVMPAAAPSKAASATSSVFESPGAARVVEALRRRLRGIPIGSCASERVALVLDLSRLDELERESILAADPSSEQTIVALTAVVGLMLRDLGAVANELEELGVDPSAMSRHWVPELNDVFGPLVAEKLGDVARYERACVLSDIKAKHLLAPLAALKAAQRQGGAEPGADRTTVSDEGPRAVRDWTSRPRTGFAATTRPLEQDAAPFRWLAWSGDERFKRAAAIAVIAVAAVLVGLQLFTGDRSSVASLSPRDLSRTSPFLASAYRSDHGRGGLLVGKLDTQYERLPPELQNEAATAMAERFRVEGLREVMLYDGRGRLQVHYASGELRRPRIALSAKPAERVVGAFAGPAAPAP